MPQPVPELVPYCKANGECWWTDPVKGTLFNPGHAERLVAEGHYRFPAAATAQTVVLPGWVKIAGIALLAWWLLGDDE
jgi:hypothetical protein